MQDGCALGIKTWGREGKEAELGRGKGWGIWCISVKASDDTVENFEMALKLSQVEAKRTGLYTAVLLEVSCFRRMPLGEVKLFSSSNFQRGLTTECFLSAALLVVGKMSLLPKRGSDGASQCPLYVALTGHLSPFAWLQPCCQDPTFPVLSPLSHHPLSFLSPGKLPKSQIQDIKK